MSLEKLRRVVEGGTLWTSLIRGAATLWHVTKREIQITQLDLKQGNFNLKMKEEKKDKEGEHRESSHVP